MRNLVSQNYALLHHEVAFLPVQDQIRLLTPLQHFPQIFQAVIEGIPKYRKIIHENLHGILDHVMENCNHASLEGCWCITQPKRHPPVGECAEGACKGSLLLILRSDRNLKVPRESVKETVIQLPRQTFQHLVDEWKREVILASSIIELAVVNANSPPSDGTGRN
ncbi:hypothetical protein HanIR_Chr01g0038971 [Helianthus annuus]|nr:hypothetical protein HanIR_Chr01g0038971 [Helianthus annuus]